MPVDIGPKIGIDGEAEFRKELNNINQQLRTLGSEMKAVTSAFDDNENSQEKLTAQSEVLTKQIDAQEKKVEQLRKGLEASAEKYGENDSKTLKWSQAVNDATSELNRLKKQLGKTEKDMDGLGQETDDAADSMDDLNGKSGSLVNGLADIKGGFDLVSDGISFVIDGVMNLIQGFADLATNTEEYRIAQGKLNTAFEAAGYGPDTARTAYTEFFKILGDTDTATEASQLLAQLAQNEQEVYTWTQIAAGVYGTFGDSLPIEGLIEAANETANVGTVTGVLADALNWAGISEDEFNEKLGDCTSAADRNHLIMETLSGTYDTATDAFYRNNEQLVDAREAQARLDESTGNLGGAVQDLSNQIKEDFGPAIAGVADAFAEAIRGTENAKEDLTVAIEELIQTGVDKLPEYAEIGAGIIDTVGTSIIDNMPELLDAGMQMSEQFRTTLLKVLGSLLLEVGKTIVETIVNGVTSVIDAIVDVGGDIVQGLWNGIQNAFGWLKKQIGGFCTGVVDAFKSFLGIHSPSTVMRDEVGVMVSRGVAEGMDSGIKYVKRTADDIGDAIAKEISKANDEISRMEAEAAEQQAVEEREAYERSIREKYAEAAKAEADEKQKILDEIAQMEDDWNREQTEKARAAEREAAEARLSELEAFQQEYERRLGEIDSSRENMTSKLSDYGDLFTEADGVVELGDIRQQISDIELYGALLDKLERRGTPQSLMDEITGMSIEDALAYAEALMGMSDEEYEEYITLWQEKQKAAQEVAERFYKDELDALNEEFVNRIPETLDGLKEEMVGVGENSAQGLADGFSNMYGTIRDSFVNTIRAALDDAKNSMGIHSPSAVWRDEVGAMMAEGLSEGFIGQMRSIEAGMQQAIPTPGAAFGDIAAGMVNGINTAVTGANAPQSATIILEINGREFARAVVPDIRAVERSNPVVLSGV